MDATYHKDWGCALINALHLVDQRMLNEQIRSFLHQHGISSEQKVFLTSNVYYAFVYIPIGENQYDRVDIELKTL